MNPLPVYILAGGRSRRFGSDKARALLDGTPLITHVAQTLEPIATRITVVADEAGKYDDLDLRTIADQEPGLGPQGGLDTALADCNASWLLMTTCDFVNIQMAWLKTLHQHIRDEAHAVAFKTDRWQPMPGLYRQSLRPVIAQTMQRNELSMQAMLDQANTIAVDPPADWPARPGINTPEDLNSR